jgi:serine/threonine-protein kinase
VVTYQLLSGRLPYEAASLTELALKQQREAPAWLHELDPAVPRPLAQAVDRALALEPAQRFASAEAMRRAIVEGASGWAPRRTPRPPASSGQRGDAPAWPGRPR